MDAVSSELSAGEIQKLPDECCRDPQSLQCSHFLPSFAFIFTVRYVGVRMSKVLKIMKADLTKNFESYGRRGYALLKLKESS